MSKWKTFMEGKTDKDDKRRTVRHPTQREAKALLSGWMPCTIIDFTRVGIGVRFHAKEKVSVGSIIYLEVTVHGELTTLDLKGIIKWIKAEGGECYVGGIELDKPLNDIHHLQLSGKLAYTPPERVHSIY